jgi:hypothetical protein
VTPRSPRRRAAPITLLAGLAALVCALQAKPAMQRVVNFFNW